MKEMSVFLTGGTGLIGSHVAERLIRDGHQVRALVRPDGDAGFLRRLGAEIWPGDVTRPDSLASALDGCEGLVHAAAIVVARASEEAYRRVNIGGTEAMLETAARAGVRRAVHVSSVAVYGGPRALARGSIDETAPTDDPLPAGEYYARSKRESEAVAWRYAADSPVEVVVVRPDVVYGERDRAVIPRLVRYLDRSIAFTVGEGDRTLPVVYAGNVADGIARALVTRGAAGRAYNLANDFPVTQRRFFELVAAALGRRPHFVALPYRLADVAAALAEAIARIPGRGPAPALNRRRVAFLGLGNPFVSERARSELGWSPSVDHSEGVRRAVAWHRADGSLRIPDPPAEGRHSNPDDGGI